VRSAGRWVDPAVASVPAATATQNMWVDVAVGDQTAVTGLSRCPRTTQRRPPWPPSAGRRPRTRCREPSPRRSSWCRHDRREAAISTVNRTEGRSAGRSQPRIGMRLGWAPHPRGLPCRSDEPGSVHEWGRVDVDGTSSSATADGERSVGQYPAGTLKMRYLLRRAVRRARLRGRAARARIRSGAMSPRGRSRRSRPLAAGRGANAVAYRSSLTGAARRCPSVIEAARARKAERCQKAARPRSPRRSWVAEAEKIAEAATGRPPTAAHPC
jgi:hypothetical protein